MDKLSKAGPLKGARHESKVTVLSRAESHDFPEAMSTLETASWLPKTPLSLYPCLPMHLIPLHLSDHVIQCTP